MNATIYNVYLGQTKIKSRVDYTTAHKLYLEYKSKGVILVFIPQD